MQQKDKQKGNFVYLVIIQDVCRVLLLLQSPQCVLQLRLKVPRLTLRSDLLAVNDLMRKSRNKAAGQHKHKYM